MTTFLLGFFTLYSLLHLYFFLKLRLVLRMGYALGLSISFFLLLMVISPVLVHFFQKNGPKILSLILNYVGYSWMGFIFLFFCSGILLDLLSGTFSLFFRKNFPGSARLSFMIPVGVSVLLWTYGYFEAKTIKLNRISLHSNQDLRIVHISDLHLGQTTDKVLVENLLKLVRDLQPQIILAAGDIVDGEVDQIEEFADLFKRIEAPLGKYAVTGNHEYYAGIRKSTTFLENSGFRVLRNEVVEILPTLTLVGFDEILSEREIENHILRDLSGKNFVVVLKHRPVVYEENVDLFDLQLSGHTHGGQIFPFRFITRMFFRHVSGLEKLGKRSFLFVTRGVGTWGPRIRVFSPPEVTLIELKKNR